MDIEQVEDRLALERWLDEGGHLAPEAVGGAPRRQVKSARVVIAGAGVAGLETLMALRALVGDGVEVTIVAPGAKFVNRSMAVAQPFSRQRVRGVRLEAAVPDLGARLRRGTLDRVEVDRGLVVTRDGVELPYDHLVLALGARADGRWYSDRMLTYRDGRDAAAYRRLLGWLERHGLRRLAFVKPAGSSWPLPLYGLALMTAARCAAERVPIEVSIITPEAQPLEVFGARVADEVRSLLERRGIAVYTGSYGVPGRPGRLDISPGRGGIPADAIVTLPRLVGPRIRGLPCTANGFIRTDPDGRVHGCDRVYAAGDATNFPIKQGGIAAQQADTVAASIAAAVGANVEATPFRPRLHGVLLTGERPRYLSCDLSGCNGDDSTISVDPLWWPPNKLHARYLSPYLSDRVGEELDVMGLEGPPTRSALFHP